MFELPGLSDVQQIVISREVIEGHAKPLYIYAKSQEDVVSSA